MIIVRTIKESQPRQKYIFKKMFKYHYHQVLRNILRFGLLKKKHLNVQNLKSLINNIYYIRISYKN